MNVISTIKETYADGPGIRYSIYVAGCKHYCKGCHNPESWKFEQGTPIEIALPIILKEIEANPMLTGITFSGGDPMEHPEGLLQTLKVFKERFPKKDIWVYTGYTIEELRAKENPSYMECLKLIDTLVDGRFVEELRDTNEFKGSSNQRIISSPYSYSS